MYLDVSLCACVCAKGLLVFADLLTRWVMLFGFCHCIHLGAHVRRSRSGQSGGGHCGSLMFANAFLVASMFAC